MRGTVALLGDRTIDRAASLWLSGRDTVDIAAEIKVSEATIAATANLSRIKGRARQMQGVTNVR